MIVHEDGKPWRLGDVCDCKYHRLSSPKPFSMLGVKEIDGLPLGEGFVSMLEFKGKIFVASNKRVYIINQDDKLEPLHFFIERDGKTEPQDVV